MEKERETDRPMGVAWTSRCRTIAREWGPRPSPPWSLGGQPLLSPSHEFVYIACERHTVFLINSSVNSFDGHNLRSIGLGGDRWDIAQTWVRHVVERETEMPGR